MSPDNPFLQALLAQPEDDTLRLAMADWLDENDQSARAEFIRVQIELALGGVAHERLRHLVQRQRELLIAHDTEWVTPLARVLQCKPGEWGGWVFRRGFVEYFNLSAAVIIRYGSRLARLTPIRELLLRPCHSENVVALCRRPWLKSVTGLYLDAARLDAAAVTALIQSPHLTSLRTLQVILHEQVPHELRDALRTRFPFAFPRAD
jgi:uncharacterized protein (TIGR02996 family)